MTLHAISLAPDGYQNSVEADRQLVDLLGNRVSGVIFENWAGGSVPRDLEVNPGEGHTVTVSEGQALIREKTNPRDRGGYFFSNTDTLVVDLPVPQSEPFYATIIARVADPQYGAVTGDVGPRIDVVSGTPASAPVPVSNEAIGAIAGTPGGWIALAEVRINPVDTGSIPPGQFTDRRRPGGFGQIACVRANRPITSKAGVRIYEVDTHAEMTMDRNGGWVLESIPPSSWMQCILPSGWSESSGSFAFMARREAGGSLGYVRGRIQSPTAGAAANDVIGILPVGIRPNVATYHAVPRLNGTVWDMAAVNINSNGELVLSNSAHTGSRYYFFAHSYPVEYQG